MPKIIPLVISGGSGTRLWPSSRKSHPKPFIKLADGITLLEKTYERAKSIGSEIVTVTNKDYYFMSLEVQERVGVSGRFILEPFGKNTGPAIIIATKFIYETYGPDTIIIVLPADHLISNIEEFLKSVDQASILAKDGYLVTFGIVPASPETGYGYIERGKPIKDGHKVIRFVEKPTSDVACSFLESGKYLWNSGMYCFKADKLISEAENLSPEISQISAQCWGSMYSSKDDLAIEIPKDRFAEAPDISIDYSLIEKSRNVAVVSAYFGWNDIGSWNSIRDLAVPDESENRSVGEAIFIDSHNTFVQSESRLVATIGTSNLMVIDTADAVLVAHADKSQDVKRVVAELKRLNHTASELHRTVVRPWGAYTVLEESKFFKIKRIEVKPGASLSLQMHMYRSEHWVVVSGVAAITNGEDQILISENQSAYIPAGRKHRLMNPGGEMCVMIEVQCGSYLGEDDIIRFEDKYGRQN